MLSSSSYIVTGWLIPALISGVLAYFYRRMLVKRLPDDGSLAEFKRLLWSRYVPAEQIAPENIQNGDRALSYVERVIDRLINKARGILPFNSIIIAALSIERSRFSAKIDFNVADWKGILGQIGILDLYTSMLIMAYSSYLCLTLFIVHFGDVSTYETFRSEVDSTVDVISGRSAIIERAAVWSITGLFFSVFTVFVIEWAASF